MWKIEAIKEKGNIHFKNEEYAKAIRFYKEGLEIEPSNVPLNCNLAQAYLVLGEFLNAEAHAVITVAQQENSVKGFFRAAKAAASTNNVERALRYLKKGLAKNPKSEELWSLYNEIRKENADMAANLYNGKNKMGSDGDAAPGIKSTDPTSSAKKNRSRSACSLTVAANLINKMKEDVRSTSVTRTTIENKKECFGPIEGEDLCQDAFLSTLEKLRDAVPPAERPPHLREREVMKERKKELLSCMKEGSVAWQRGLPRKASEKYKAACDIMAERNIEVFGLTEVDHIVLKYSLSFSWIDTLNYNNIVQSVVILTNMELNHAAKLPAVYFALGHAFYRLNRFKVALLHLDKGKQVLEKDLKVTAHPWPGTMDIINETTKAGLRESINTLMQNCRTYREPDAVCRYKLCLSISTHISPSEQIFYSDPDYVGYVTIICQQKCKITYHIGCWKDYKERQSSIGKLSDKDVLGQRCLTSDCLSSNNEQSVITRIEIYGDDGNLKSSCTKDPGKVENNKKEPKKEKKKKNNKTEKAIQGRARPRPRPRRVTLNAAARAETREKSKLGVLSSEFDVRKQQLASVRKSNFGNKQASCWDPHKEYFGRDDIRNFNVFLTSQNKDSEILKERKNFIFTYFFEFLKNEGPQKISVIESKWQEDVSQFPGISEFMSRNDGICEFLLQSRRFASLDDYLCLPHQLAHTYQAVQVELGESVAFIVDSCMAGAGPRPLPAPATVVDAAEDMDEDWIFFSSSEDDDDGNEEASEDGQWSEGGGEPPPSPAPESAADPSDIAPLEVQPSGTDVTKDTPREDLDADGNAQSQKLTQPQAQAQSEPQPEPQPQPEPHPLRQLATVREYLDSAVQTDESPDYKEQADSLKKEVVELKLQISIFRDVNKALSGEVQGYAKKYKQITEERDETVANCMDLKEKDAHNFKLEISKKDAKYDTMKKKYEDQLEKMTKKLEEDSALSKKNLVSMNAMNKQIDKQECTIRQLEEQVRKSNQQQLDIRKLFGEHKLDSYLGKCKERLDRMRAVMSHFQNTGAFEYPKITTAIQAWTKVHKELCERRELLQVQYDILSQQIKSVAHSDSFLQLELGDLPLEPPYPTSELERASASAAALARGGLPDTDSSSQDSDSPSGRGPLVNGLAELQRYTRGQDLVMLPPAYSAAVGRPSYPAAPTPLLAHPVAPPNSLLAQTPNPTAGRPLFAPGPIRPTRSMEVLPGAVAGNLNPSLEKKPAGSSYGLIPIEQAAKEHNGPCKPNGEVQAAALAQKKRWNYSKLLQELQKNFCTISEAELSECLVVVREKNGNKLSGLAVHTIFNLVEKVLREKASKKIGNMGMDKFGVTAWGQVKENNINWQGEIPDEEECIICHIAMIKNRTFLECKHTFHTECIRTWLHTNSTCPICRKYTKLVDEFPPLA